MDSTQDASANYRNPARWNSVPVPDAVAQRALANVDKQPDGCWISRYSVSTHGYAQIGWGGSRRGMVLAHRAAWVAVNGQLPLGVTIDHVCKERRCVNPDHLRLLPNFENARRTSGKDWPLGTCANGHDHTNLIPVKRHTKSGGVRWGMTCKKCKAIYTARYKAKKREAA